MALWNIYDPIDYLIYKFVTSTVTWVVEVVKLSQKTRETDGDHSGNIQETDPVRWSNFGSLGFFIALADTSTVDLSVERVLNYQH